MIDKICTFLTNKIRKEMPDVNDEEAEIINYGLQNIIGEFPKTFIVFGVAYFLGIFEFTVITFLILLPYRSFSGGFHLKTHIGCIISTTLFYCGVAFASKSIVLLQTAKYILILLSWIFGMWMVKLYAPADTENVPILRKKDRRKKKILSYIALTVMLLISFFIKDNIISNIIIFGSLIQSFMITKLAYKLTRNKYGYEVYNTSAESV